MNFITIFITIFNGILPTILKYLASKKYYLIVIVSLLLLILSTFAVISYTYDNSSYKVNHKGKVATDLAINMLKKCGDGSAISISAVSVNDNLDQNNNISYGAEFVSAYAISGNEIVDLQQTGSIYREDYYIDISSYNLFLNLGTSFPVVYDLKEGIDELLIYPSIYSFIKMTEWGKLGKIDSLYLTSIITDTPEPFNKKVIYVISFMINSDFKPKKECDEIREDLRSLKEKIKNL